MRFLAVTRKYFGERETWFALTVFAIAVPYTALTTPLDLLSPGAFVAGVFFWLLIEYPIHRFYFHMPAPKNQSFRRLHKRLHSGHHQAPDNPALLFIPWWVTMPSAVVVLGVAIRIAGARGWQFFVGFWTILLVYEWLHLAIHLRYSGRSALYQWIRKGHMLHHFKNEHYWFGITNPLADYVMRTHPAAPEVPTSQTARTLGYVEK